MKEDRLAGVLANSPARISDVLEPLVGNCPDRPAVVEVSGTWTYAELSARVSEARGWLRDSGVRPGDRVLVVCENCRAFVAILLALAALDAWPVLLNARLSASEVDQIRGHCGARLALYTVASPHAKQHAERHGAAIVKHSLGPLGIGPLNENVEPEPIEPEVTDRVAALIYTSGTTGRPKGVMLTHRGLLFVAAVSSGIRSLQPNDRLYGVLPMSHAVGLSVVLLGTLLSGATLYLASRFDPVALLGALEKDGITVLLGTPSMFSLLLDYAHMKGMNQLRPPHLRIVSSSGAPLHAPVKAAVERAFGLTLHNGYGITECSPNIAQTRLDIPRKDLSVGKILPGVEIRLVGTDGRCVTDGEVGELQVRGPNVMKGYYRAPRETAEALDNAGWFNTRDLARIEDEHLFIVGRTKELIIRFGLNVYPSEIEAVLNAHPSVTRSAVIGRRVGAEQGGEEAVAFVERAANLSMSELVEHAARNLAAYKRPSEIVFVPNMPLTPTGKVMKDELARIDQTQRSHQ